MPGGLGNSAIATAELDFHAEVVDDEIVVSQIRLLGVGL
jgi:hypothetical protein